MNIIFHIINQVMFLNYLGLGKLEIVMESEHAGIETLILYGDGIRITADSLRYLPNLVTFTLFSGVFDTFPNFLARNHQLVDLILYNFGVDGNFNAIYPSYSMDCNSYKYSVFVQPIAFSCVMHLIHFQNWRH